MDIIIDVIPLLDQLTGVGKYTYYVTKYLLNRFNNEDYYFFAHGKILKDLELLLNSNREENIQINTFKILKKIVVKIPYLNIYLRKIINIFPQTKSIIFDIYFEPNFVPFDLKAKKIVATVHDLSFLLYPEWHPISRVKFIKNGFFTKTLKSDAIITPSNFVKEEILERFPNLEDRIFAIHLGVDHSIFNPFPSNCITNYDIPEKYILFVGSIEPRKNLINLLKAYITLPPEIKEEYKLLLVGFKGWKNKEIMSLIKKSHKYVKYIGYVPENVLAELYRRATIFIYPSLYEGFGLPPLEAMACGCPVIVSKVASIPEVCKDAAVYIENPQNPEEISFRIQHLLEDKEFYLTMKKKALKHAKKYDWEKTAEQHYKVFKCIT